MGAKRPTNSPTQTEIIEKEKDVEKQKVIEATAVSRNYYVSVTNAACLVPQYTCTRLLP